MIIQGLNKIYMVGKVPIHALSDINLEIHPGEFLAIMGKSGSGKSTLLNQIGLIDSPDSGKIIYEGENLLDLNEELKNDFRLNKFGFIFQEHILFPELNVLENIYLPAIAAGIDTGHATEQAGKLMKILGMEDRLAHKPHELSGGQKQRVSVARALINDPEILFSDEPTANLDSKNSEELLQYLRYVNTNLKKTIVMVTHDPDDRKFVDRAITLKDGRIVGEEVFNSKRYAMLSDREKMIKELLAHISTIHDAYEFRATYKQLFSAYMQLGDDKKRLYYDKIMEIYNSRESFIN